MSRPAPARLMLVVLIALTVPGEDPLAIMWQSSLTGMMQSTVNDITTKRSDVLTMTTQATSKPNQNIVYSAEEAVFGIELWLCLQDIIEIGVTI